MLDLISATVLRRILYAVVALSALTVLAFGDRIVCAGTYVGQAGLRYTSLRLLEDGQVIAKGHLCLYNRPEDIHPPRLGGYYHLKGDDPLLLPERGALGGSYQLDSELALSGFGLVLLEREEAKLWLRSDAGLFEKDVSGSWGDWSGGVSPDTASARGTFTFGR